MVTESAKTNPKIKRASKPRANGRVQSPTPEFSDAPERLHLEEFNYAEVKAAAEAMRKENAERKRKGIKETEAERDLRVYGTTDVERLSTMELLRRNPIYALEVLESEKEADAGLTEEFVPFDAE